MDGTFDKLVDARVICDQPYPSGLGKKKAG